MEPIEVSGRCVATPVLFFTLAGKNPRSERVLTELCGTIREKHPGIPQPECVAFPNAEMVKKYFQEGGIDPHCAVGLFDVQYCGGRSFFPMVRGNKKNGTSIPDWLTAQWAIAINTKIDGHGIRSASYQITADFLKRFSAQIAEKKLPWGDHPDRSAEGKRRRKNRKERRKHDRHFEMSHAL